MISVKTDFQNRKEEIDDYYELLENIIDKNAKLIFPDGSKKNLKVDLTATLKSGAILLLYNIVESTISNSLQTIHEIFSDDNLMYQDLNDKIQVKILKHYYSIFRKPDGISEDSRIVELQSMINVFSFGNPVNLYYEDFVQYKTGSQFSGNLDAKEIRNVVNSYGMNFTKRSKQLRTVRDKRNKLAHGELSFRETCNTDSMIYMKVLKDKTIEFLEDVIQSIEVFLDNQEYKTNQFT